MYAQYYHFKHVVNIKIMNDLIYISGCTKSEI